MVKLELTLAELKLITRGLIEYGYGVGGSSPALANTINNLAEELEELRMDELMTRN